MEESFVGGAASLDCVAKWNFASEVPSSSQLTLTKEEMAMSSTVPE